MTPDPPSADVTDSESTSTDSVDSDTTRSDSPPGDRETVLLDPHVHTAASYDAEGTVHEVLGYCHNRGVDAVAITDHDTTVGARRALAASHWYDVVVIPGVEVSTADGHVLGAVADGRTRAVGGAAATRRYLRKYGRAAGRRLHSRAVAWTP